MKRCNFFRAIPASPRLQASIERLKLVGTKVQQLELRKRAAVEREDYDVAKALKASPDRTRYTAHIVAVCTATITLLDKAVALLYD